MHKKLGSLDFDSQSTLDYKKYNLKNLLLQRNNFDYNLQNYNSKFPALFKLTKLKSTI